VKNEGGSRETARSIYTQMADEGNDSETQYYGKYRLSQLDSLDEREAMNAVMNDFRRQNGRCVAGWTELVPLLRGVKLPNNRQFRLDDADRIVDPSGAAYMIDREKCETILDAEKTKIPLN
jgi:hypothetical protein